MIRLAADPMSRTLHIGCDAGTALARTLDSLRLCRLDTARSISSPFEHTGADAIAILEKPEIPGGDSPSLCYRQV